MNLLRISGLCLSFARSLSLSLPLSLPPSLSLSRCYITDEYVHESSSRSPIMASAETIRRISAYSSLNLNDFYSATFFFRTLFFPLPLPPPPLLCLSRRSLVYAIYDVVDITNSLLSVRLSRCGANAVYRGKKQKVKIWHRVRACQCTVLLYVWYEIVRVEFAIFASAKFMNQPARAAKKNSYLCATEYAYRQQ